MNSLTLLRAMNGIYEEDVIMAGKHYFINDKKTVPIRAKRLVAFAIAAVLMLSLGIAAYAAYNARRNRAARPGTGGCSPTASTSAGTSGRIHTAAR